MGKGKKGVPKGARCDECRWFFALDGYDPVKRQGEGFCHRYPPQMVVAPAIDPEMPAAFEAEVGCASVCGEWEPA